MGELTKRCIDALVLLGRRWWIVLGCALICAGLGWLWTETIAGDGGSASSRVGFGRDPEYFDIVPNIDRIEQYIASAEFASAFAAASDVPGLDIAVDPPNGILAFVDINVSGAASDDEAAAAANAAGALVVEHMNGLFDGDGEQDRLFIEAEILALNDELPALEAESARLLEIEAANSELRFEDEAAFSRYGEANDARNRVKADIDRVVRQRTDAEVDLADLIRNASSANFEVLRPADGTTEGADRPVWPLAAAAGLGIGALMVLARDRNMLPIRESADLDSIDFGHDALLVDGSVKSVALLLRRRVSVRERVVIAGFGLDTQALTERLSALLTTLELPNGVVPFDEEIEGEYVGLTSGGDIADGTLAEVALRADYAVLAIGRGAVREDELSGPVAELHALGVNVLTVLVVDRAATSSPVS